MNKDEAKGSVADARHVAEQEFPRDACFTQAECRKLAFARWLYRTGRLTELVEDGPGR